MRRQRGEPVFQRDPEWCRQWHPVVSRWLRYFRPEVRGSQDLPEHGPMLLVSNHGGGLYTPEVYVLIDWWLRERGYEEPFHVLAHDILFTVPWFGEVLRKAGGIPASMGNAERALDDGAAVLVFPGGDHEAFRPWWHRDRVDFAGRTGFLRLALRRGVPVVPIVCHGNHDTTIVLTRGDRMARWMELHRVRSRAFPLVLGLPWGVVPGFMPIVPLPARITVQVLPALDWSGLGPQAADDEVVVQQCYEELTAKMQATLDSLVAERPLPWFG